MEHIEAYKILRINPPFTENLLKSAFREAAMRTHPDLGGKADEFRATKEAFDLLLPDAVEAKRVDPIKRTVNGIPLDSLGKGAGGNRKTCVHCGGKGYYFWEKWRSSWDWNDILRGQGKGKHEHSVEYFLCTYCNGEGAQKAFNPVFQAMAFIQPARGQKERKREGR